MAVGLLGLSEYRSGLNSRCENKGMRCMERWWVRLWWGRAGHISAVVMEKQGKGGCELKHAGTGKRARDHLNPEWETGR